MLSGVYITRLIIIIFFFQTLEVHMFKNVGSFSADPPHAGGSAAAMPSASAPSALKGRGTDDSTYHDTKLSGQFKGNNPGFVISSEKCRYKACLFCQIWKIQRSDNTGVFAPRHPTQCLRVGFPPQRACDIQQYHDTTVPSLHMSMIP